MLVRILIWSLVDSSISIEELRAALPPLQPPSMWIWNEVTERLGLVAYGEELPEGAGWARDLVGDDPDVYEEFDVLAS